MFDRALNTQRVETAIYLDCLVFHTIRAYARRKTFEKFVLCWKIYLNPISMWGGVTGKYTCSHANIAQLLVNFT